MASSEIYSNGEIALIFIIISIFSIVIPLIYLCLRINHKKVSWYIFILCFIYAMLFVFLLIIAMFDLVFNNQKGFKKFSKVILKYYEIFDYIDKFLGYILFPIIIYYLESGHFTIFRRIVDGVIGIFKELVQALFYSFRILLFIALLIILIKYRKHYGIDNFWDYLFIMLDCYAIIDIYICVGFFLVQTIIDCNRSTERYRNYSLIKIMNKTEYYINKMKDLSKELNKNIKNYTKDKSSSEYINIENTLNDIEKKLKKYESKSKENINNINIHNIKKQPSSGVVNMNNEKNPTDLNNGQNNKNKNPEIVNNLNIKENQEQKVEINESAEKKPKDPVYCNKKYKKYIRRIDKLSLLYKEIDKETKEDVKQIKEKEENPKNNDNNNSKNCCTGIMLFISYFIAILSDFFLPIFLQYEDNYIDEFDKYEKEKSTYALSIGIIISVILSIVCNAYTVIVIYATKRRRYITGDYLYDKKINDNINLLKTVQLICGYSFTLVYCNLYYWATLDKKGVFGIPLYRRQIIIPDYTIKSGISVFMIIKVVIIIVSIIFVFVDSKISVFKNDLAEFNSCSSKIKHDSDQELNQIENEKRNIFYLLNNSLIEN